LTEESVDDGGTLGDLRSLEEEREDRQDGVEVFEVLRVLGLVLDTLHEFGQDDEIQHERSSQEGIFADVDEGDGVVTTHEDAGSVFIEGALGILDVRDVLDDDAVIRVFVLAVEDAVGADHIVDDVALGDFLGAELLRGRQVLTVVVTQVIVRDNRARLDTSRDEEIDDDGLDLGLTSLEVITTDVDTMTFSEFENTRDEGVLGRTVDESAAFEDGGNGEDGGRRDFRSVGLDGGEEVVGSIVQTGLDFRETFSVGSPENDDLVETIGLLEVLDVLAEVFEMFLLGTLTAHDEVISTIGLVSSNEVFVVDGGERLQLFHFRSQLLLEIIFEDFSALHGLSQVGRRNVPTADDDLVRISHGEEGLEGDVDLFTLGVGTNADSGALSDRAEVVRGLFTSLGIPLDVLGVSEHTSREG